jgi:hypothetical protein
MPPLIWIKAVGIEDGNCERVTTRMKPSVIVWDLETVPDLGGFAAANDLVGKSDVEVYHSIVCIEALIAHREPDHWVGLLSSAQLDDRRIGAIRQGLKGGGYIERRNLAISLADSRFDRLARNGQRFETCNRDTILGGFEGQ